MDPPTDAAPKAPRMSIKFNAPKPNGAAKPSSLGKRSRAHALGGSSDSESEDRSGDERGGRRSAFGGDTRRDGRSHRDGRRRDGDARSPAGGETMVIGDVPKIIRPPELSRRPKMRNRVVDGRRGEGGTTKEVEPADADKEVKWGLNPSKRRSSPSRQSSTSMAKAEEDKKVKQPRTVDEQAMDRLMGKHDPSNDKVIALSERDSYARDVDSAPPPDPLDLETGMEVSEFGAAMLRGMGWDGEFSRPGFKQVDKRANQLGLGAKELKGKEDLGGWNQKGKGRGDRPKRLVDYRRDKEKENEGKGRSDSYKRERERERERDRDGGRDRDRDRDRGGDRRYDRDERSGRDERRRR